MNTPPPTLILIQASLAQIQYSKHNQRQFCAGGVFKLIAPHCSQLNQSMIHSPPRLRNLNLLQEACNFIVKSANQARLQSYSTFCFVQDRSLLAPLALPFEEPGPQSSNSWGLPDLKNCGHLDLKNSATGAGLGASVSAGSFFMLHNVLITKSSWNIDSNHPLATPLSFLSTKGNLGDT